MVPYKCQVFHVDKENIPNKNYQGVQDHQLGVEDTYQVPNIEMLKTL